jgi:Dolichol-phosphate mannosyltransferase subunit 3 (DPM3)
MTKLVEWLSSFLLIVAVWYALLTEKFGAEYLKEHPLLVLLWPVGLVGFFGLFSVAVSIVIDSLGSFRNPIPSSLHRLKKLQ